MPTPLPWRSSVARHDAWKAWEQDNTVTSRTLMGARQMEQGSAGALGLGVAGARFFAGFCGVSGAAPPFFDFFPAVVGVFGAFLFFIAEPSSLAFDLAIVQSPW